MKIERYYQETTTLANFADAFGLVLEVHERPKTMLESGRRVSLFYARFKGVEVAEGGLLAMVAGDGDTEPEAIKDYATRISGKTLRLQNGTRVTAPDLSVGTIEASE